METTVLLHCTGSSGGQWRALLSNLGHAALAPDLSSCGTLAGEAAALRIAEPVHLVGHSYGGAVALHIARTRPEMVKTLTLVEPSAFHLLEDGEALREITAVADDARAALAAGDHSGGYGRFVEYWTGLKRETPAPPLANVVRDFDALFGDPGRLDDIRAIGARTLLIQGTHTKLPSRTLCARLRVALPQATFRTVEGAGHMSPITHREAVNTLITTFLQ